MSEPSSVGIERIGKKCPNGYVYNKKDGKCHTKKKKASVHPAAAVASVHPAAAAASVHPASVHDASIIERIGKKCPNGYVYNKKDGKCHTKKQKPNVLPKLHKPSYSPHAVINPVQQASPIPSPQPIIHSPIPSPQPVIYSPVHSPRPIIHSPIHSPRPAIRLPMNPPWLEIHSPVNPPSPQQENQSIVEKVGKKCPNGYVFNKKDGKCHSKKKRIARSNQTQKQRILTPPAQSPQESSQPDESITQIINRLNMICSDSGQCIAVGKEIDTILSVFNNFNDFQYANTIKQIGEDSVNGVVYEIKNTRNDYITYNLLKLNRKIKSDSLIYEYIAGKYVNHYNKYFPCFIQTYHLLKFTKKNINTNYTNKTLQQYLNNNMSIMDTDTIHLKEACTNGIKYGILIQHISNASSLHQYITKNNRNTISKEIIGILLQIYIPLSKLSIKFTHNDLHHGNVLLYKPFEKKCIKYQYFYEDGTVIRFYSQYVVKLIDYGISYFENNSTYLSRDELCNEPTCKPNCGWEKGFKLSDTILKEENYFLSRLINNSSNDLRLLRIIGRPRYNDKFEPEIQRILDKVIYRRNYGTPRLPKSGLPDSIHNVRDACIELKQIGLQKEQTNTMDFHEMEVAGIMNVYVGLDREMEYISF
jgi:hypothetical protein